MNRIRYWVSNYGTMARQLISHNLKIIFASRFLYFFGSAVLIFLFIMAIGMLDDDFSASESIVYYYLLLPGLLLIFYPMNFSIYNDMETGMMEMLVGIPDYRYKVWLVRLIVIWIMVYVLLVLLAAFSYFLIIELSILEMAVQLMFPIFFFGTLSFFISTLVKNGNGSSAIMVIIGLVFWMSSGILGENRWNIFLNPFAQPSDISETIWLDMLYYNRLYMIIGIVISLLGALYRLQKREKFI